MDGDPRMVTAADITADALRQNLSDLDEVIFKIRRLHLVGKEAPKAAARYRAYVRRCHELREKGLALGLTGSLLDFKAPTPIHDQLVGYSAEQRKALEWRGVFDAYPFPASVPSHFKIAAE